MIQLEDVAKRFRITPGPGRKGGVVDALVDITAEIKSGEVVAVVGPNGAGKSTLFSVLLGFLETTAGDVAIDGLEPRAYMRAHGAGYLPERFRLPPEWTVEGALTGLAKLDRIDSSAAQTAIDAFGLREHAGKTMAALSHGMLQRVGLAQATMGERALVVLDEPTEGLDAIWRVRFRDVVAQLRARNATVLIASHDLAELERLADRAIVLEGGRVTDVISLRERTDTRLYRIELAAPHDAVVAVFPGATDANTSTSFTAHVSDVADLNRRVAALIAAGAHIVAVAPAETLENRVTRGPA